jgi:ABC-type microcin C transport system permease subunit YejE
MSLKPISFVLRTTGLTIMNVLNRLKMPGALITTLTIVPILLVLNLRNFEEFSSIGLKASQTSLNSLLIAI